MTVENGLRVLVVGGGMYVAGRGTDTDGTILPALLEARRQGLVSALAVCTTGSRTANDVRSRGEAIARNMGLDVALDAYPDADRKLDAYLDACEKFQPDAAVVVVPDHLHAEVTVPLLERGIHCLVVKPLAPTLEQGRLMEKAARKAGVLGQVEFHKRLDDSNVLLRDAVAQGRLGSLLYAVIEYSQQKRIPLDIFRAWADRTSVFQYLGVHYVDLLQFVTGFTPKRVTAWAQEEYLAGRGVSTPDAMQVVVEWDKGDGSPFVSTHITNWIDPDETSAVSDQKINLVGTAGRFQADQKHRGVQEVVDGVGVRDVNPYFSSKRKDASGKVTYSGYGIDSVLQFVGDVHGVKSGATTVEALESRPTFSQCLVSTAVVEAAHESLARGSEPVDVRLS